MTLGRSRIARFCAALIGVSATVVLAQSSTPMWCYVGTNQTACSKVAMSPPVWPANCTTFSTNPPCPSTIPTEAGLTSTFPFTASCYWAHGETDANGVCWPTIPYITPVNCRAPTGGLCGFSGT